MEGHRAHLERQAHDEHDHREDGQGRVGVAGGDYLLDARQVGMPGGAVEQRASEEQNCGSKRAKQDVLHRCLDRSRASPSISHEGIGAKRHRLEAEENGQQVDCTGKHHRSERGEYDDDVELAALVAMLPKVSAGQERREPRADANDNVEEQT